MGMGTGMGVGDGVLGFQGFRGLGDERMRGREVERSTVVGEGTTEKEIASEHAINSIQHHAALLSTHKQRKTHTHPRFFSTIPTASSCLNVNMPQPVCLMSTISVVPRSCSLMMMERRASRADAPA